MYNVWNTLYPESVEMVIQHANKLRYSVEEDKEKSNAITITDEWQSEIEKLPFISKQKGKMSHLLKEKSKIEITYKPRVTYEHFPFEKRTRPPIEETKT